jgi:NADH-quinone oxidoreductase subunit A
MPLPFSTLPILAQQAPTPRAAWAPVALMIVIAVGFTVGNVVLSLLIGPSRTGAVKEQTYESGMTPIGDTRKRFNVRFYIVAMVFLVFDVEIVFMYPWASIFAPANAPSTGNHAFAGLLLVEMIIFVVILLVAYFYAWGKGVFRWD